MVDGEKEGRRLGGDDGRLVGFKVGANVGFEDDKVLNDTEASSARKRKPLSITLV